MLKKHKIIWSPIAVRDFNDLLEYIIENNSRNNAFRIQNKLMKKIASLELYPERNRIPPELKALGLTSIRELVVAPYSVFYRFHKSMIGIVGVLDRRRDLEEIIFERNINAFS